MAGSATLKLESKAEASRRALVCVFHRAQHKRNQEFCQTDTGMLLPVLRKPNQTKKLNKHPPQTNKQTPTKKTQQQQQHPNTIRFCTCRPWNLTSRRHTPVALTGWEWSSSGSENNWLLGYIQVNLYFVSCQTVSREGRYRLGALGDAQRYVHGFCYWACWPGACHWVVTCVDSCCVVISWTPVLSCSLVTKAELKVLEVQWPWRKSQSEQGWMGGSWKLRNHGLAFFFF